MSVEFPNTSTPEKEKSKEDNARKFLLEPLEPHFFEGRSVVSYGLVIDWTAIDGVADTETKLVKKDFGDHFEFLEVAKITDANKNRKAVKNPLTEDEYNERLKKSILHLEKTRHEFSYTQDGATLAAKYDVFEDGILYMIELDGPEELREAFDAATFPATLTEVSDDENYTGHRMAKTIQRLKSR